MASPPVEVAISAAVFTAALTLVAQTIVFVSGHQYAVPIFDGIFDKLRMNAWLDGETSPWAYFFAHHNEHVITTTRLVSTIDYFLFDGQERLQVAISFACQAAIAFIVTWQLWSPEDRPRYLVAGTLGILLLAAVNGNFLYTFLIPFQVQHAIAALIVTISAFAISRIETLSPRGVLPVLLCAALLSITVGSGPSILLAMFVIAVVQRWGWKEVVFTGVLAAAHLAFTLATTPTTGSRSFSPVEITEFVAVYLGSPMTRLDAWPAPLLVDLPHVWRVLLIGGFVMMAGAAFFVVRLFRPRFGGRLGTFGLSLFGIVAVTGLAAAISRAQFGVFEGGSKKYASFAVLGWIAVFVMAWASCNAVLIGKSWRPWLVAGLAAIILPLSYLGFASESSIWEKAVGRNWEAASAAWSSSDLTGPLGDLYRDWPQLAKFLFHERSHGKGLYGIFPASYVQPANEILGSRTEVTCRGEVQTVAPAGGEHPGVFNENGTLVTTEGWAVLDGHSQPAFVLAVDTNGHIDGVAPFSRSSSRAEEWLGQSASHAGWFGYARVPSVSGLTFFVLTNDGHGYCLLGGAGNVRM